eukprot:COSAG01_NODE_40098_length_467_cov_20.475543_2_plen_96_part_01
MSSRGLPGGFCCCCWSAAAAPLLSAADHRRVLPPVVWGAGSKLRSLEGDRARLEMLGRVQVPAAQRPGGERRNGGGGAGAPVETERERLIRTGKIT